MSSILSFLRQPGPAKASSIESSTSKPVRSKKSPVLQKSRQSNQKSPQTCIAASGERQGVIDLCESSDQEEQDRATSHRTKRPRLDDQRKRRSSGSFSERKSEPIRLDESSDEENTKEQVCTMCAKKLGKMQTLVSILQVPLPTHLLTNTPPTESNRACQPVFRQISMSAYWTLRI